MPFRGAVRHNTGSTKRLLESVADVNAHCFPFRVVFFVRCDEGPLTQQTFNQREVCAPWSMFVEDNFVYSKFLGHCAKQTCQRLTDSPSTNHQNRIMHST